MLGFFTFYSDYTRDIRYLPGNIIIKDCIVENADRFLHYNFSGNETWQKNKPLSSIEFENVKAIGVKNPLTAYGDVEIPISLYMKNCEIQFVDDREDLPFMYISNAEKVLLKDTVVRNLKSDVLIKKWNDSGDFTFDNFMCENFTGEISMIAKENFVCQPI